MPPAEISRRPRKCDLVIVRNYDSNGINEHPAIVTRYLTERIINVMVMPDGGHPFPLTDIEFYQTRVEAISTLAQLPVELRDRIVAYWPEPERFGGH